MNLAELALEQARTSGAAIAAQMGSRTLTYAELAGESDRVAAGLRDLGVRRGDRVLMFSENNIEYLIAYHATARLGGVFTPIHASFQIGELAYVLANSTPRAVIAQEGHWDRLERCGSEHLPDIRVVVGPGRDDLTAFDQLGERSSKPAGVVPVDVGEPVLICYTSGTTDRPLPVTRSHANEIWNARTYADVCDYRAGDRALITMPLSWVWGLSTLAQALLATGATVVLHAEFGPAHVLQEIEASKITLFAGTMSMYIALLGALKEHDYDLSSLRRLFRGGEPINSEVVEELQTRIGLRLYDAYATTEVAPVIAVDPVRDPDAPPGTAGLVPGTRICLVDDDGNVVLAGDVGEAWLGGPGVMLGYWNEPEITAERLTPDGWFRSGDLLVEGAGGYFFVVGRSADVIIRNGAKIAPAEVESALTSLPGIRDSVAVGVPDEEFGESIVAFVVLDPGCVVSIDDMYAQLSDRIARFKLPSHIYFVDELPLRHNEKRDRATIRRHALESLDLESGPSHGTTVIAGTDGRARLRLVE